MGDSMVGHAMQDCPGVDWYAVRNASDPQIPNPAATSMPPITRPARSMPSGARSRRRRVPSRPGPSSTRGSIVSERREIEAFCPSASRSNISDAVYRLTLIALRLALDGIHWVVIKSWANRSTQRFAEEGKGRFSGLDKALARRRLRLLDEADRLEDLTGLSSVGLHRLRGARRGQWAISAGGPWRIIFEFRDGHAWNVEIVDYH